MRRLLEALTGLAILALTALGGLTAYAVALPAQGIIVPRCAPCTTEIDCSPARTCTPPLCRGCPAGNPVVRTASTVRVTLTNRVARYEVDEIFTNRGPGLGEADYLFPMPTGAAFEDLRLDINGELVSGETMPADRARAIYEEIVRRQRDPALVEWMGAGLLRTRIFPIATNERKRVVVRFQSVARREGDALRVDYRRGAVQNAAGVVRRPGSGSEGVSVDRDRLEESFTLVYRPAPGYGEPYSPTHELDVREVRGERHVTVRGSSRDVTILIPVRDAGQPAVSVLTHAVGGEPGFALVTLAPPAVRAVPTPRDVTVVIDVSGSMRGEKMRQARAAGREVLGTLARGDRFRVIAFSSDVRTFREGFSEADATSIAAAGRWIDALQAEGSTNISGALDEALDHGAQGTTRMPIVLFITDGEPTVGERDPERIAMRVGDRRGRNRVFTFGVGEEVNAALVERLALEGRGTAHFVRPNENVERAVGVVARQLQAPLVTDLRVRIEGAGLRLENILPGGATDVFAGQDLVLVARYTGTGRATLVFEGSTAQGPVRWTQAVNFPQRERGNDFVPRLWATQRIGVLSAERRRNGASAELDDEMRTLGERYGIPTELTSYLVLEPGMQLAQGNAALRRQGAPAAPRERFEEARAAAQQRSARSVAAADMAAEAQLDVSATSGGAVARPSAGGGAGASARPTTRRVGSRMFVLRDGAWTDVRHGANVPTIRIRAFSAGYFSLIDMLPEIREALAQGERVVLMGRSIAIEIGPEGGDTLSARDVARLRTEW